MKIATKVGRLALIVIVVCALFLIFKTGTVYAQDSGTAPAPEVVESQPNFPDYIVRPREEANPYDLSTIEPDDTIDYREGTGTLGTTTERKSNAQINETLRQRKEERDKARREAKQKAEQQETIEATSTTTSSSKSKSPGAIIPGVKGGLFRWTDADGVLHATNDLGYVPIEYQIQALEKSNSISVNKNTGKKKR